MITLMQNIGVGVLTFALAFTFCLFILGAI
jgi:hypothetical protein